MRLHTSYHAHAESFIWGPSSASGTPAPAGLCASLWYLDPSEYSGHCNSSVIVFAGSELGSRVTRVTC
jgi:hypothetical protein